MADSVTQPFPHASQPARTGGQRAQRSCWQACLQPCKGESAGFQTCCVADFQIGGAGHGQRFAGLATCDTANLEVCATSELRRQITLARSRNVSALFRVSRNFQLIASQVLPSPAGRKTIAQRFNAGWTGSDRRGVPSGTTEARRCPAPLSSLTGLGSRVTPGPSVETLGYCRTSLRDRAATASCAHARNRCCPIPKGLRTPAQGCATGATLGVAMKIVATLKGLCPVPRNATTTPSGLMPDAARVPRVAPSAQPWALGRNPFGIQSQPPTSHRILASGRVSPSPSGRKIIAQRFNAGWTGSENRGVPSGTAEVGRRPSPLSSLRELGSWVAPDPSVETLGYARTSLRDWAATTRCAHVRIRCQRPLARPHGPAATRP